MSTPLKTPPTLAELHARRDEIVQLAAEHGVSNVRVVGSVAWNEAALDQRATT